MERTRLMGSAGAELPRQHDRNAGCEATPQRRSLSGRSGDGATDSENDEGCLPSSLGARPFEAFPADATMSEGASSPADSARNLYTETPHSSPEASSRRGQRSEEGTLAKFSSPSTPPLFHGVRDPHSVSDLNNKEAHALLPVAREGWRADPVVSDHTDRSSDAPSSASASRRRRGAEENPQGSRLMGLVEQALASRRSGIPYIGGAVWSKDGIPAPDPFAPTPDVGALFRKGAKTGRLRLRWVILENFKSYKGTHVIGPLSGSVAVIGPNGAGKSNLTDAVCFALGVNAKQLRCTRLIELIHSSESRASPKSLLAQTDDEGHDAHGQPSENSAEERLSASVTLHFVRGSVPPSSPLPERISFTRRISHSGECFYLLDDVAVPLADYREALRRHCSCTVHTLQAMLIFQGHIDALATKSAHGLAGLVEEISGSSELLESYHEAQKAVRETREEARRLLARRMQLEQDMKVLRKQKNEADAYEKEQRLQKEQQDELFLFRLLVAETLRAEEEAAARRARQQEEEEREQLNAILTEAQQADRHRVAALLRVQKAKDTLAASTRRSNELRGAYLAMMERFKFLEKEREAAARQRLLEESQREELEAFEEALKGQLIRAAEKRRAVEAQLMAEKEKDDEALLPEDQKLLETLEDEWEEQHALQQQRIRNHQQQLQALRTALDLLLREEREMQGTVETVRELHGEAAAKAVEVADALQRLLTQAHDAKESLDDLRKLASTSKQQRESLLRLQRDLGDQLAQERSLQMDVRRAAQEREVCTQLKKHVSHSGVHGSALECCRPANKRLLVATAAAMGAKANSLIVDSHALALRCVDYLKTARLGSREFLPLDALRRNQLKGHSESSFEGEDEDDEGGRGAVLPPPPAADLPPGCRWAVDCVSFQEGFRPVYEFLLSDCIIVPSLAIAQELKFGASQASARPLLHRYRFVTLDGEKLQCGGVISFDLGGLTGRLAARWEAQQQERLVERLERVKEQLHTLENAETTNAERLQQRTAHFALLHRQSVQLQAKARVWEDQAEAKSKKLAELQAQLQSLQERVAARKEEVATKQQELEEIHASLQQQQQRHFARLDRAVGRVHVHLEHKRRRQRIEALKAELAGLHARESQMTAELADCSDRLRTVQRLASEEAVRDWQPREEDEKRLLKQLELTERDVEDAEKKKGEAAREFRDAQQELNSQEKYLQTAMVQRMSLLLQVREREAASKAQQKRFARDAAAAEGRQKQQVEESWQILRQADQQGVRLPLSAGSWRGVRASIYAVDADKRNGEEAREAGAKAQEMNRREDRPTAPISRRRSDDVDGEMRDAEAGNESQDREDGRDDMGFPESSWREQGAVTEDEKLFAIDFSKLAAEKCEFIAQHKDTPSLLFEAASSQEAEFLRRAARLRTLQPNLKATEKEQRVREQLATVETETDRCQREGRRAENRLARLQRERNARFLGCFHHCKLAVDFFFRELTAAGVPEEETEDGRRGCGSTRGFERIGGRAYLDLECPSGRSISLDEEAFACGVSLLCMPPGKRLLPLHLLSGGERLVAALALVLALLSFVPHVPFLLFDEVDAPLDSQRRRALARVLKLLPRQAGLQVLFISLKDKMFSTADMLVGVAKQPAVGLSRCFFLDLLPYHSRRGASAQAPRPRLADADPRDAEGGDRVGTSRDDIGNPRLSPSLSQVRSSSSLGSRLGSSVFDSRGRKGATQTAAEAKRADAERRKAVTPSDLEGEMDSDT
ncbi:RecF/RecN/SMC N terminal domain-containing protein [Besnoitia besnoiti]|uniref:RecF/RecN/SMC N terminal domain-containing protein n=1 Tax=Besnoitia besnoiti TaxID=94643 RepID=A0A2A9M7A1_BESBE|nr:RecF/RecN/SMC N terminal domain-containing protein [Besnoitia besnoiti]PFH32181.1 RecF/RecN/SMC N terminal domain-containing protein [Besnoitia besnoiti]